MEKRLFLAVTLSITFLLIWGALIPKFFPDLVRKAPVTAETGAAAPKKTLPPAAVKREIDPAPAPPAKAQPSTETPERALITPIRAEAEEQVRIETDQSIARFTNRGAQLVSFQLKSHKEKNGRFVDLVRSRETTRSDYPFAIVTPDAALNRELNESLYAVTERNERGTRVVDYILQTESGVTATKSFRFSKEYPFHFQVALAGTSEAFRVTLGPGIGQHDSNADDSQFNVTGQAVIQREGSFDVVPREKASGFAIYDGVNDYIGLEDNYFLAVFIPERDKAGSATVRAVDFPVQTKKGPGKRKELYVGLNSQKGVVAGQAFFGPKEAELLERYNLDRSLQFGFFGVIARFLLVALVSIYGVTHNYGWAIVVLTVVIKLVLLPLQHKSMVSMKKMQQVQPKMNAIKEKFRKAKTDAEQRQRMNLEMMNLYKQEGINPASGCFPILLQIPILFAFYSLLSKAIELRGAEFIGWITDLSIKDPYYITPALMTITMFIQQWMTPSTVDPVQRKVFLAMPIVFGWIFKEFPSGLVLYWLVQNVLTIIQQMIMNRRP